MQVKGVTDMAKQRSVAADYLVYLLVRTIVCLVQTCSATTARSVASGLAWLVYHVDKRHRQVALDNLRQAFPGRYSEPELDVFVRETYRHFCTMLIEIIQLPRKMHVTNWLKHIDLQNGPTSLKAMTSGQPLLVVTGHFGNWEMAGYALGLLGFSTHAVARPLDNPFLDRFLRRFREATGQQVLNKNGDAAKMQKILDHNGVIATLADQDAGPRGLFVDFFGRPASTHKAIALLSIEHSAPLLVIGVPRVGGRYIIVAEDLIDPAEYDQHPDALRAMTQRFTSALERVVRTAPEQYFWLHRRWKHQPAVRKKKVA